MHDRRRRVAGRDREGGVAEVDERLDEQGVSERVGRGEDAYCLAVRGVGGVRGEREGGKQVTRRAVERFVPLGVRHFDGCVRVPMARGAVGPLRIVPHGPNVRRVMPRMVFPDLCEGASAGQVGRRPSGVGLGDSLRVGKRRCGCGFGDRAHVEEDVR